MVSDAELAFVEQLGRHFARQYSVAPMTGRVAGWLMICDPPQQTAAEIAAALGASRSAIGSAVTMLESWGLVRLTRRPGERADRIGMRAEYWERNMDPPDEYLELANLARSGLDALADAPPARRARLAELVAFAEFLAERMPALAVEWRERRDSLRSTGDLPVDDNRGTA
jgi:DNA-binding transcriptional ArsR family regulator